MARRFFGRIAGLSVCLLLLAGAIEGFFGYRQARDEIARLQAVQVRAAAAEIEQYLEGIVRPLQQVQALPWGHRDFGSQQRREELHGVLALSPSIVDVSDLDDAGVPTLSVSRRAPDRWAGAAGTIAVGLAAPADGSALRSDEMDTSRAYRFERPFFDREGVPHAYLRLRPGVPAGGSTVALINLRFLAEVASGLRVREGGEVYVVDADDQLIAHADPTQALRQRRLSAADAVGAARRAAASNFAPRLQAFDGPGLDGQRAITTATDLRTTGWLVFVEQPHAQVMRPVWATLLRTLMLLLVATALAMLVGAALARRLAAPISRLRAATATIAAGHLEQQLHVHTGDEIEGLAEDFNAMSRRLQRSYGELEAKVTERTAELALRREEAERANAAKTRFLASASHDLRQPMHAIGLLVGVLQDQLEHGELHDLAFKTHQAVQAMQDLFEGLLDISRLDAGAVSCHPRSFALQTLLDRVNQAYASLAAAKGIELRFRATAAWVRIDPSLLERIVSNLVSNAIRYTAMGGVLVGCRLSKDAVRLVVVDTGLGIEADKLEVIFEEFVRIDEAGQTDKGLGLGLAIVRRTADLLEIPVAVRSTPGRGSCFSVRVPLATLARAEVSPARGTHDDRTVLSGAFVLVVDDDHAGRHATAAWLAQCGCHVVSVATAEEAMSELQRHLRAPDAIVTDLRLSRRGDGLELIARLRAELGETLPALLVCANPVVVEPGQRIRVLQKPVGTARLLNELALSLRD